MKTEIEARILEIDVQDIKDKLVGLGSEFKGDWLQLRNIYDFNPVRKNSWIRLRTNGKQTTLTIKEIGDASISGTKECEIEVSSFEQTNEILNRLGYNPRSVQENRRIRYVLDDVEIDIDIWPMIPPYVEFEADSEEKILEVCHKLGIDTSKLVTIGVSDIYKQYGHNIESIPTLKLEVERKETYK